MIEGVPPEKPLPRIPLDPEIVDAIARSFACALSIESVTAAIERHMSRFFPPGSWSLTISGPQENLQGLEKAGDSTSADSQWSPDESSARVPMRWESTTLGWIDCKADCKPFDSIGRLHAPAGFVRLVADYAAIALRNVNEISRIQELAIVDDCTGLFNCRHLTAALTTEIERSRRFHLSFSLLFIDLDYFKRVNDAHGHMAGSWLLARVAETIQASIRGVDSAYRYGGDEFVVLLPQTRKEPGLEVGVRLLKAFRVNRHQYSTGVSLGARASIGLAAYPEDGQTAAGLILAADTAMYQVKNSTRDNIAAAGSGCILEAGE